MLKSYQAGISAIRWSTSPRDDVSPVLQYGMRQINGGTLDWFDVPTEVAVATTSTGEVPADETAWLFEHDGTVAGTPCGRTAWACINSPAISFGKPEVGWVHDSSKALHFSRRGDAEAFRDGYLGLYPRDWDVKAYTVTEHLWLTDTPAPPVSSGAEATEWKTPPASWRLIAKAALNLLCAIDERHDGKEPPLKYAVPYGAVNDLRQALGDAALVAASAPEAATHLTSDEPQFTKRIDEVDWGSALEEYCSTSAAPSEAEAQKAAPHCLTCSDHGSVGVADRAEPCPDCTPPGSFVEAQKAADFPLGAIINGRTHAERLEFTGFECEGGNLLLCTDWVEFRRCFEHLADYVSALPNSAEAQKAVPQVESLCGWQIDAAQQALDSDGDVVSGVWELGHLDPDGNFYAIATVDTGNYDQPEAAEPLARAILARLVAPHPSAVSMAPTAQPAPQYPLPDSLYPDSKDWLSGDYSARVAWLHSMYEWAKQERPAPRETLTWISVNDQLPPDGKLVMTLSKQRGSSTGYSHSYSVWSKDNDSMFDDKQFRRQHTYWMLIPELPDRAASTNSGTGGS